MTIWKKIPLWDYSVSDDGHVRNDRTMHILTPMRMGKKRKQYSVVSLCKDGKQTRFKVHHLVLANFVGPCPSGLIGRHLDDDTNNNSLSNLMWGTRKENSIDCRLNGNGGLQVISEAQAKEIRTRRAAGERGRALAREFGITEQTVCDIYKGRIWK